MNILHAIDKDHSREVAKLRRENRALRRQLRELDAQARKDRQDLGAALITLAVLRGQFSDRLQEKK